MEETKRILRTLCEIAAISGYENAGYTRLQTVIPQELFSEFRTVGVNNAVFIRRCGKEKAPLLLVDAHFDEIGMMVRSYAGNGCVKVAALGGLDLRCLLGNRVCLYGKETVNGIVCVPSKKDGKSVPPLEEICIDTGLTDEALRSSIPIGTPVGFSAELTDLQNDYVAAHALDNRACCAAALRMLSMLSDTDWDVAVMLSGTEESTQAGAQTGTRVLRPDAAMVLDVNFARAPGIAEQDCDRMEMGPSVTVSARTNRNLTLSLLEFARKADFPCQTCVCPMTTGTNADKIAQTGVPTVQLSVPLKNMHTPNEIVCLRDIYNTARLLAAYIKEGLPAWYRTGNA